MRRILGLVITVSLLLSLTISPSFAGTKAITKKVQFQTAISKMKARIVVVQNKIDAIQNASDQCMQSANATPGMTCDQDPMETTLSMELDDLNSIVLAASRALVLGGNLEDAFVRSYEFELAADYASNESQKSMLDIQASEVADVALAQKLMPFIYRFQDKANSKDLNLILVKFNGTFDPVDKSRYLNILRTYAYKK